MNVGDGGMGRRARRAVGGESAYMHPKRPIQSRTTDLQPVGHCHRCDTRRRGRSEGARGLKPPPDPPSMWERALDLFGSRRKRECRVPPAGRCERGCDGRLSGGMPGRGVELKGKEDVKGDEGVTGRRREGVDGASTRCQVRERSV